MKICPASDSDFTKAIQLLKENDLPTDDIHAGTQLFVALENDEVAGTIAVEYDFNDALLRSLSVHASQRSKGFGATLVDFIEDYVKQQGVQNIYLLTTTAAGFFAQKGYRKINRSEASAFLRNTSEYSSVCPSSATLMVKTLT